MRINMNGITQNATPDQEAQFQSTSDQIRVQEQVRPLTFEEVVRIVIRKQINRLGIDTAIASRMVEYFPELTGDGSLIKAGSLINWNGCLMRAASDLWDQANSTPDTAPELWKALDYQDGVRVIPETVSANAAFFMGELGWRDGILYRSKLDANVWTPEEHPQGWEIVCGQDGAAGKAGYSVVRKGAL